MFYSLYLYFGSVSHVLKLELKLFFQNFGPVVIEMYSCLVPTQETISTCTYMPHLYSLSEFQEVYINSHCTIPINCFCL